MGTACNGFTGHKGRQHVERLHCAAQGAWRRRGRQPWCLPEGLLHGPQEFCNQIQAVLQQEPSTEVCISRVVARRSRPAM